MCYAQIFEYGPFHDSVPRKRCHEMRCDYMPLFQNTLWLHMGNRNVYVQKIKGYVQKIEALVVCLHMMEFPIYKYKIKNCAFTKN